jgi:hypothetical protein
MAFGLSAASVGLLGIGAGLVGGAMQSGAVGDAAESQAAGSAAAAAEQRRQYDLTRSDYAPARFQGDNALNEIARYLGLPQYQGGSSGSQYAGLTSDQIRSQLAPKFTTGATPAGLGAPTGQITYGPNGNSQDQVYQAGTPGTVDQAGLDAAVNSAQQGGQGQSGGYTAPLPADVDPRQDPGYQFGLDQGMQGLDRKIAAGGGRVSGASLKAATQYATNYATTGYNAAYQRRQDRLNRLQSLAGLGQTATGGSAAAGSSAANAISGLYRDQGDNAGSAQLAQGNIWGNAINQGVAAYQNRPTATNSSVYKPGVGGLGAGGSPDGYW